VTPALPAVPESLLVLQLKRLGDLVLALPALHALRAAAPERRVTLVTEAPFVDVLGSDPPAHDILVPPKGALASMAFGRALADRRFDAAVDFQGSATSARLAWQSRAPLRIGWELRLRRLLYTLPVARPPHRPPRHTADQKLDLLRALGVTLPDTAPFVPLAPTATERQDAGALVRAVGVDPNAPFLLAAPASRRAYKRWAPASFAEVLDQFHARTGQPVVLAGGPGEAEQVAAVADRMATPAPRLTVEGLRRFLALLSSATVVVAPDGGARQLAEAAGTATLALFGPQEPGHWTRLTERHAAVSGRRPDCRIRCARGEAPCACLQAVPPERVAGSLVALWRGAVVPDERRPA
jgi:ADP-heptose:LPS heptosyltransferase